MPGVGSGFEPSVRSMRGRERRSRRDGEHGSWRMLREVTDFLARIPSGTEHCELRLFREIRPPTHRGHERRASVRSVRKQQQLRRMNSR